MADGDSDDVIHFTPTLSENLEQEFEQELQRGAPVSSQVNTLTT